MINLVQIVTLCRDLECVFTINNDWSGTKDAPQVHYEWRSMGSQRGESNGRVKFIRLDDCLQDCLNWLTQVKNSRIKKVI